MLLSIQVSVPNIISGYVLLIIFSNRCCLVFMDWKFTFKILSGCCFTPFGVESSLVGVDVCTGLIWFDDTGLEIDVSDKTLN